ncbi:MAG: hypothetical protein LBB90_09725 [Tannerella sp.]|jgi:hypothetical protein|nr:hypothetical protein [Tannerella sp.]
MNHTDRFFGYPTSGGVKSFHFPNFPFLNKSRKYLFFRKGGKDEKNTHVEEKSSHVQKTNSHVNEMFACVKEKNRMWMKTNTRVHEKSSHVHEKKIACAENITHVDFLSSHVDISFTCVIVLNTSMFFSVLDRPFLCSKSITI